MEAKNQEKNLLLVGFILGACGASAMKGYDDIEQDCGENQGYIYSWKTLLKYSVSNSKRSRKYHTDYLSSCIKSHFCSLLQL